MALRLNDLVEAGELFNTRNYSVHGWLKLRGRDEPLVFELTGNCSADLQGCHIRFEGRAIPTDRPRMIEPTDDEEAERIYRSLFWRQIGATGDMTVARKVKWADCSLEELTRRSKLGEPPRFEWKTCLYLEWFIQNGRVIVELVAPIIKVVERRSPGAAVESETHEPMPDQGVPGLGVTSAQINEDSNAEVTEAFFRAPGDEEAEESPDDPYGLFPPDLQRQLDADAASTDRSLKDDGDLERMMRETELMDDLIEHSDGQVLASYVVQGRSLPSPDKLSDAEVEAELKALVGQMALFNIAFDVCVTYRSTSSRAATISVTRTLLSAPLCGDRTARTGVSALRALVAAPPRCEHCSPRDAYRLLVTHILPQRRGHPELRGTGWVQHHSTRDHRPQCEAQAQPDFEEYERKRKLERGDQPPADAPPGEDV